LIIDGHVCLLRRPGKTGLGAHLYTTLKQKIPVVGIAKTCFFKNELQVKKVFREVKVNDLYM
jgi:deoxyribonuclease V